VTRPAPELRGFARVTLAPGERKTVSFPVGPAELSFLDREMHRGVEPGLVDVMVGGSSIDLTKATLEVVAE
jgi:beta-glucosidase